MFETVEPDADVCASVIRVEWSGVKANAGRDAVICPIDSDGERERAGASRSERGEDLGGGEEDRDREGERQSERKEGRKGGRKEGRCHKSEASNVDAGSSQRPGNEAFSALNEIIFHILI